MKSAAASFFRDLLGRRGVLDRQRGVGEADQEHGVPLQPFRGVQRGQGHPLHRRRRSGNRDST